MPEFETQSVDSMDVSLRIQLRKIDQCLNEMQYVQQSKGENPIDPTLGRSPFTQNIQEELIPTNFRFPLLEAFVDNIGPIEHIAAFYAHISLFMAPRTL